MHISMDKSMRNGRLLEATTNQLKTSQCVYYPNTSLSLSLSEGQSLKKKLKTKMNKKIYTIWYLNVLSVSIMKVYTYLSLISV